MTSLSVEIASFFRDHLQTIRGASPHTIRSYAFAIRLYLTFLSERKRRAVTALRLDDLDVDSVVAFLNHLEKGRRNVSRSRNCRLAALRSFFRFVARHDLANADEHDRILSLPSQRQQTRPAVYLEPDLVRAILAGPDRSTAHGLRDHALLLFLYNSGARISEALGVRIEDFESSGPQVIRLRGKGKRERLCPLWPQTAVALRGLAAQQKCAENGPLFRSARGAPLSRDGAAYILAKYTRQAAVRHPALRKVRVTPHVLRHSCAVALLQAGVDLTVIRDYLGHASVATTNHYVSSNLEMKRRVLDSFWKRSGLDDHRAARWRPTKGILAFLDSL